MKCLLRESQQGAGKARVRVVWSSGYGLETTREAAAGR